MRVGDFVGDVSRVPVGLSARGAQGGLLVRRDEHKGDLEAEWCVDNLVLRDVLSHGYLAAMIVNSTW
jgi:hypothetical protein